VYQRSEPVDEFVIAVILARLSRPDVADLLNPPKHVDVGKLRAERGAIQRNLEEMFADAVVNGYKASLLSAASVRANRLIAEIDAELAESAQASALTPFLNQRDRTAEVWAGLDLARQRVVVQTLCTVTLHPVGRRAHVFDPAKVKIDFGASSLGPGEPRL
jgi:hypothetical protein